MTTMMADPFLPTNISIEEPTRVVDSSPRRYRGSKLEDTTRRLSPRTAKKHRARREHPPRPHHNDVAKAEASLAAFTRETPRDFRRVVSVDLLSSSLPSSLPLPSPSPSSSHDRSVSSAGKTEPTRRSHHQLTIRDRSASSSELIVKSARHRSRANSRSRVSIHGNQSANRRNKTKNSIRSISPGPQRRDHPKKKESASPTVENRRSINDILSESNRMFHSMGTNEAYMQQQRSSRSMDFALELQRNNDSGHHRFDEEGATAHPVLGRSGSIGSSTAPSLQGSSVSSSSSKSHREDAPASREDFSKMMMLLPPPPPLPSPKDGKQDPGFAVVDNIARVGADDDSFAADTCWDNGTFKSYGSGRSGSRKKAASETGSVVSWENSTIHSGDFLLPKGPGKLTTFSERDEEGFGPVKQNNAFVKTHNKSFFVFRRKTKEGRVEAETTLKAHKGDTMADLVRQLQGHRAQASNGGLLTFSRREVDALRRGERRIVFILKQVKGAKFGKDEFGSMTALEALQLTTERPVVVDIRTESCVVGETVQLF